MDDCSKFMNMRILSHTAYYILLLTNSRVTRTDSYERILAFRTLNIEHTGIHKSYSLPVQVLHFLV